ncbi:SRPBCC domain-containing protein [Streptomyces olivochromogenes]|uniref:SRPBCC domain-containing protein n=1 Tax=Streptomyces olivochromogenes TaxID=1963 RepID=UPI0036DAAA40
MTGVTRGFEEGAPETREDGTRVLHYLLRFPQPVENVWNAVATPEGLRAWLAEAEVFEPRLGGEVTLRGLGSGRITAWDVERIAEYTVEGRGRIRFHLEPTRPSGTTVRFTHESPSDEDPGWRERFEELVIHLASAPDSSAL